MSLGCGWLIHGSAECAIIALARTWHPICIVICFHLHSQKCCTAHPSWRTSPKLSGMGSECDPLVWVWDSGSLAFTLCSSPCRRLLRVSGLSHDGFIAMLLSPASFEVTSRCRAEVRLLGLVHNSLNYRAFSASTTRASRRTRLSQTII